MQDIPLICSDKNEYFKSGLSQKKPGVLVYPELALLRRWHKKPTVLVACTVLQASNMTPSYISSYLNLETLSKTATVSILAQKFGMVLPTGQSFQPAGH